MSDEFEDMESYDAPAITLDRFLSANPRYGERVAEGLKDTLTTMGTTAGKTLHEQIRRICFNIGNNYSDRVMGMATQALKDGLPPDVAATFQAEVKANGGDEEEVWDDTYFEATADAIHYFIEGFMPYVLSMPIIMGEALDYNMPMPISDEIREAYEKLRGKIPDPPTS